jgi:hypothetical protein
LLAKGEPLGHDSNDIGEKGLGERAVLALEALIGIGAQPVEQTTILKVFIC